MGAEGKRENFEKLKCVLSGIFVLITVFVFSVIGATNAQAAVDLQLVGPNVVGGVVQLPENFGYSDAASVREGTLCGLNVTGLPSGQRVKEEYFLINTNYGTYGLWIGNYFNPNDSDNPAGVNNPGGRFDGSTILTYVVVPPAEPLDYEDPPVGLTDRRIDLPIIARITVDDGTWAGATYEVTKTVTVELVNVDEPTVGTADSYELTEDSVLNIASPGLLSNDTDPDTTELYAAYGGESYGSPQHGWVDVSHDGSFTYTPFGDYYGEDGFTYKAYTFFNNGLSVSDYIPVTLHIAPAYDPPTAVGDTAECNEDGQVTIDALANDENPDGSTLHLSIFTPPIHGSATVTADKKIRYVPSLNYNGPDSITYDVRDSQNQGGTAVVNITVLPVNDAPTPVPDVGECNEDSSVTVNVLANDSDVEGQALTLTGVTDPGHGTAQISDAGVTYTPDHDYFGSDSVTYTVSDGSTANSISTGTLTITVNNVQDPPVAVDDSPLEGEEDNPLVINVLMNDSDVDNDVLTVSAVGDPVNGTAEINPDNTITYSPNPNWSGTDSFSYTINDGNGNTDEGTVNINIAAVNDIPIAITDRYFVKTTGTLNVDAPGVLANDTDVESSLSVSLVSGTQFGTLLLNPDGSFDYQPSSSRTVYDTFTYRAYDGEAYSDPVQVTIQVKRPGTGGGGGGSSVTDEDDDLDETETTGDDIGNGNGNGNVTPDLVIIMTADSTAALVNDLPVTLDAAPYIKPASGRTMVPVRFVSEQLGQKVELLKATRQIRISSNEMVIVLTLGSNQALVNGNQVQIDSPAEITSGRTFVPLRFVSETLGANTNWNRNTRNISVSK